MGAAHDQRRGADPPQPVAELGVVQVRVPAEPGGGGHGLHDRLDHLEGEVPDLGGVVAHVVERAHHLGHRVVLVVEQVLGHLAGGTTEDVLDGGAVHVVADRVDQHQVAHPVGVAGGQLGRHPPAQRGADDGGRTQAEGVEQVEQVEGGVLHVVDRLDALRLPEAREDRGHHGEGLRELGQQGQAGSLAGGRVEVDERVTLATSVELDLPDPGVDEAGGEPGHYAAPG